MDKFIKLMLIGLGVFAFFYIAGTPEAQSMGRVAYRGAKTTASLVYRAYQYMKKR